MFYIVEMKDLKGKSWVAVVHQAYFEDGTCAWAKTKNSDKLAISGQPPRPTDPKYEARILHAYGNLH